MIIFVTALLMALGNGPVIISAPAGRSTPGIDEGNLGSCRGDHEYLDLRQVMFLKNNTIDIKNPDGPLRITLDRQKVRIQKFKDNVDQGTHIVNIGNIISGEPDVVLTLGFLDNRPVLYWKETFVHRSYRQGLFKILGQSLVPLCQGVGGGDLVD